MKYILGEDGRVKPLKNEEPAMVAVTKPKQSNAEYYANAAKTGLVTGVTSIPQSTLQEYENALQKGSNIKTPGQVVGQITNMLSLPISSPDYVGAAKNAVNSLKNIWSDKNKSLLGKVGALGVQSVDNASRITGTNMSQFAEKSALPLVGAVNKGLDEKVAGIRNIIGQPAQKMQQQLAEEGQNHTGMQNMIAQGIQSTANMIPSLAATAVTKNPDVGLLLMTNNAKGQATEEALQKGASLDEAIKIGNAKGLTEYGTEKMTGGLSFMGKGALDDVVNNAANKYIKNQVLNFAAKAGIGIGGEVAEEIVSDIVGTLIDKGTLEPNKKYTLEDLKNTVGPTVISTLILNALSGGYGRRAYQNNINEMNNFNNQQIAPQVETQQQIQQTEMQQAPVENTQDIVRNVDEVNQMLDDSIVPQNEVQQQEMQQQETQDNIEQQKINEAQQIENEQNNLELENEENTKSKILNEMPKQEQMTFKQKVKDNLYKLRHHFTDHQAAIYDMSMEFNNPTLLHKADAIQSSDALAQNMIGKRQTNLQGKAYNNFTDMNGNKVSMGLKQAFDLYNDIPIEAKNSFLVNELNLDRLNQGVDQFDINYNQSEQMIEQLKSQYTQIEKWADNVWQYNKNQLQNMVDAGLVSQEVADSFMEQTPHYIRIQRNVNKQNGPLQTKGSNIRVNNQIQKVKGSTLEIMPISETNAKYTQQVMKAIRLNQFSQELAKTIGVTSEGQGISSVDEMFSINPKVLTEKDGKYSLTMFNEGQPVTIPINKGIYESLQTRDLRNVPVLSDISKFQREVLTNKNPYFALSNAVKDAGDMFLYSKFPIRKSISTYAELFGGRTIGRGINKLSGNDGVTAANWVDLYENTGNLANSYLQKGEYVKESGKLGKTLKAPLNAIEAGNNFIESMPRITEFVNTIRENGYTLNADGDLVPMEGKNQTKSVDQVLSEASYNAAEVTTNFKRGGTWAKNMDRNGATFLNASIQGASKLGRTFTEAIGDMRMGNYKSATRLFSRAMTLGVAPALLGKVMYKDDKEYEELPDYVKEQYYVYKMNKVPVLGQTLWKNKPEEQFIRIPKGRAVSIFESAAKRTGQMLSGKKGAWKGFDTLIENQIAPNNPIESNVLAPLGAVKKNEAWSGNPIVSEYLEENFNPSQQYDAKTSEFSKWVGKKLKNVPLEDVPFVGSYLETLKSPKKLDYLIDQYSGVIGDVVLPSTTNYAENENSSGFSALTNPLKSKFTTNSTLNNKTISEYNALKTKTIKDANNEDASNLDKAKKEYIASDYSEVKSHISSLYAKQREIQNSKLSDSEKYKQNKQVQQEIVDYMKKVTKELDEATEKDGVVTIGSNVYVPGKTSYGSDTMKALTDKKVAAAKSSGLPIEEYAKIDSVISNYEADKDANGKSISGSKKTKAINYLKQQGYSEDKIKSIIEGYGWKY